jgi:hypothetical protein
MESIRTGSLDLLLTGSSHLLRLRAATRHKRRKNRLLLLSHCHCVYGKVAVGRREVHYNSRRSLEPRMGGHGTSSFLAIGRRQATYYDSSLPDTQLEWL